MPLGRRISRRRKLVGNALTAYAAGLMDGEGCVRWNGTPSIEVTNKHRGALQMLQDRWGGSVRLKGEGVFVWTVCGANALSFIDDTCDYSVIKRKQIIALLFAVIVGNTETRKHYLKDLKRLKNVYTD